MRCKPNSYHFTVLRLSLPTPSIECPPRRRYGERPTTHREPSPGVISQPVAGSRKQGRQGEKEAGFLPREMQPSNLHTIKHKAHRQRLANGGGRKPLRRVSGEQLFLYVS